MTLVSLPCCTCASQATEWCWRGCSWPCLVLIISSNTRLAMSDDNPPREEDAFEEEELDETVSPLGRTYR